MEITIFDNFKWYYVKSLKFCFLLLTEFAYM